MKLAIHNGFRESLVDTDKIEFAYTNGHHESFEIWSITLKYSNHADAIDFSSCDRRDDAWEEIKKYFLETP